MLYDLIAHVFSEKTQNTPAAQDPPKNIGKGS
jgi:hypothetical protein